MTSPADTNMADWLGQQTSKSLLRFLTCGSVDDGKSTLIGRLLYDSQLILDDQLATLKKDSRNRATGKDGIDFSLLVDGLAAEREQGITIDVAYRFFETEKRKFIVADTPGHEQYTRNMATGASNAELAILLVDARKGLLPQTRRHAYILSLIGVRHVVMVVNKIDLVDFSETVFNDINEAFRGFAEHLGFDTIETIPVSALDGDNIVSTSTNMPWYSGPALLPYLETIEVSEDLTERPMRFPVQWVNRPNLDFRGFSGTLVSGTLSVGGRRARRLLAQTGQDRPHRHARRRSRQGDRGPGGYAGARSRGRHLAAATSCAGPAKRRNIPISSRRDSCGCTRNRPSTAAPTC